MASLNEEISKAEDEVRQSIDAGYLLTIREATERCENLALGIAAERGKCIPFLSEDYDQALFVLLEVVRDKFPDY